MTALAVDQSKPVIRRSLAEGLLSCPQFMREDAEYLAFGTAFHSFAAMYFLQCKAYGEETRLSDVSRLSAEAWAQTPGLLQSRWNEFMQLCERFANGTQAELDTLLHIERTLTVEVDFAILTCTVDRIDRADTLDPDDDPVRFRIRDWKTEQGELDHTFQVAWYTQVSFLTWPSLQEVEFYVVPVRERWTVDPIVYRRGDLDLWWRATLNGLQARLAAADLPPVGGPSCPGCSKRISCAKATAEARDMPDNFDQADELFGEQLRMEEALKVRKRALELFYEEHEPRVVNGHEVGFLTPRDTHLVVSAKPLDVVKFLNKRHMEGASVLKVDVSALGPKETRQQLVDAGMASYEYSKPEFKHRKYVPAREGRKKKQTTEEETE